MSLSGAIGEQNPGGEAPPLQLPSNPQHPVLLASVGSGGSLAPKRRGATGRERRASWFSWHPCPLGQLQAALLG